MSWLRDLFGARNSPAQGDEYRVVCRLYSPDGLRSVEVRAFRSCKTYLVEHEHDEANVKVRNGAAMVGPFESPESAERFIIATQWFKGNAQVSA